MSRLFKYISGICGMNCSMDDDYVDRLNRKYNVIIFLCFGVFIGAIQFFGVPMNCWCPAEFSQSHKDYANSICWISTKYYLPMSSVMPSDPSYEPHSLQRVSYSAWIPLILISQALFAVLPYLLWRLLIKNSGINIAAILDLSKLGSQAKNLEERQATITCIVHQLDKYLLTQREYRTGLIFDIKRIVAKICCLIGGELYGNYLISCFMIIKVLYLVNLCAQFFLIESFLNVGFQFYGLQIIERLIRGQDWSLSDRFPRVVLCDFEMRHQGRIHSYTVQCALPINIYNEKLFLIIWFWFVFLMNMVSVNIVKWLFQFLYCPGNIQYLWKHLRISDSMQQNTANLSDFYNIYLRNDGLFIIRLISVNVDDVIAGEIICGLWKTRNIQVCENFEKIDCQRL